MPRYRLGQRPTLDPLIIEKAGTGGIFSTKEAAARGVSRQMLSYYEQSGKLVRIRQGIYKSALIPETLHDNIYSAAAATEETVVAGPSALALQAVGHLESSDVWLRPIHKKVTQPKPRGTHFIQTPVQFHNTVDLGGLRAETVTEAIKTIEKENIYDADQIEEARTDAISKGLI